MQTTPLSSLGNKKGRRKASIYPIYRLRAIVKTTKTTRKEGNKIFQGVSHSKQASGLMIKLSAPENGIGAGVQHKPVDYFIRSGQRTDNNSATRDGYTADQVCHSILQYMEIEKLKMRQPRFALDAVSKEDLAIEDEIRKTLYDDPSMQGVGATPVLNQVFMQAGSAGTGGVNQSVPTVVVGMLSDDQVSDTEPLQEEFQLIEQE